MMTGEPAYTEDTIVAPATPAGSGGVAVVRLSGPAAGDIGSRIAGELPAPRHAALRRFVDAAGRPLDVGLALWMPGPNTFTGEDVFELHAHGSPVIVARLVAVAVACGARRAEPGEFSRRAFLNERLDLAQAEAIADLIASGSEQAARAALRTLTGDFSAAVDTLADELTSLRVYVEAAIDFPEEEIDFLSDADLATRIAGVRAAFDDLASAARAGRILNDGLQVVIVGRPNAGKSSLLNALAGQEAAIVTEVAGTTRDILRERIDIDGLLVELVDTAGLRDDPDRIEAEGIRRARDALARADVVLWISDATAKDPGVVTEPLPAVPVLRVLNKIDLVDERQSTSGDTIRMSARTGQGLDDLRRHLLQLAGLTDPGEGAFTARQRHLDALAEARRHFDLGVRALETDRAGELLAEELRLAGDALGRIAGRMTSDDMLGRIFAEFCIGK